MGKLTDTQFIILSNAAERDDWAAVVPDRMTKSAALKVGSTLVGRKLMREIRSKPGMPIWREDEEGRRISLIITRAGRDVIGVEDEAPEVQAQVSSKSSRQKLKAALPEPAKATPRAGSKQALVVSMLSKDKGTTLDALIEATGWLPHTTRAAMTGLRKRGYIIERKHDEARGSLYRIVGNPKAEAAGA